MGKSGVNTGFAKCFILFMAVIILIQGCVYLGLSIWGITQQNCSDQSTDIAGNPFQTVIDLIYFINEKCETTPSITLPNGSNEALNIDWAKSYMITNRMYIFIIVYAVISGLWIVASLLVIATICGPVTKLVSAIVFWPWFLVVIAGSILDVVATGYHIHDIIHTTTAQESFDYIGVQTPSDAFMLVLGSFDAYFITPAVVMTCVSSRVVIMWLLNIFGTSFCLSLSRVLSKQRTHPKHTNHHRQNNNNSTAVTSNSGTPAATAAPYNNPYTPQNETQVVEYTTVQKRPAPLVIAQTQPQQTQQQQQQQQPQYQHQSSRTNLQSPYAPNAPALTPDVVIIENPYIQEQNRQTSPIEDTTYRKTDSHPDRLDYPSKTPTTPNHQQSPTNQNTTAQLSSASVLNNRYSTADGFYSPGTNQSPQRVNDELRSQLPWSYTSMLTKPQPPRKPQVQVYPQIPEPDYTEESNQNHGTTSPGVINDMNQSQQAYSRW